jgi:class 3 adenylate cyclase/tetratricopeptide (TPR) repeat protein
MICGGCGTENEPGGRFCEACGTPLAATCPSCGEGVKADARFCRSCGFALNAGAAAAAATPAPTPGPAAAEAPVAERRLVTVLFADLVGFTTLAEDRDPESTRELLTRYFDTARDAIERHGGTVEKFIGDAVMAVWGTPVAHEDDAERAVRAALELVREVPSLAPQLAARAGVLTGEAAVTLGATNQGMVAGDLVNTAARLQGVAEPGTVLVGESTMRAAERAIVFEEVGAHSLKGKMTPVPAWRAVRVVAQRGGQQRADALEPPFVGRDEELRLLKEQLHAPGRDQRARLVSITGPGGIGKSRLVWELEKYMDGVTEPVYWHRGRSPSYGEGITFWALGEMIRRRAGLTEDDDDATTRERIRSTVEEYVADHEERATVEPALLTLLGIGEAAGGRDALFPAWRTFFERISERGTTALIFEDLQWADTGLLDFIDHILDWSKSRPILVVTLARPELFDKRPDWGAGRRAFTSLALDPLTDDAVRQLLEGVVPGLPENAISTIVARAEGMPLYAVETVRTLLAEGKIERDGDVFRPIGDLSSITVPESLRSLIASRLDAVDPADRALLQDASVLGQVFDLTTLADLTGEPASNLEERLRELARREIVELETDPRSPERGQYKFVQALIREVAYGTLALRDRRARHLAAARHYESRGDEELAGALAGHYLAAHEASAEGAEADAVAAQARIALRAAADRAASLGAHDQAVRHVERALPITTDLTERAELLERAATAAHYVASIEAERYAREAVAAYGHAGDTAAVDRATAVLGQILLDRGQLDEAVEVLEPALSDERAREPAAEAALLAALGRAYIRLGRNDEAAEKAEAALAIAEPHDLEHFVADALGIRAAAVDRSGRRREAVALLRAAVELADSGGWADLGMRLRYNLGVTLAQVDPRGSADLYREVVGIAERVGSAPWFVRAGAARASANAELGQDWDEAIALVEDAAARAGDIPPHDLVATGAMLRAPRGEDPDELFRELEGLPDDPHLEATLMAVRAEILLSAGRYQAAAPFATRVTELDETGEMTPWGLQQLGHIALCLGDLEGARLTAERVRQLPKRGAESSRSLTLLEGGIAAMEGNTPEARRLIGEALADARRLDARMAIVTHVIAALHVLPDAPEAPEWEREARATCERVGAVALLAQLDALREGRAQAAPGAERSPESAAALERP